jgi:hypothetical protein
VQQHTYITISQRTKCLMRDSWGTRGGATALLQKHRLHEYVPGQPVHVHLRTGMCSHCNITERQACLELPPRPCILAPSCMSRISSKPCKSCDSRRPVAQHGLGILRGQGQWIYDLHFSVVDVTCTSVFCVVQFAGLMGYGLVHAMPSVMTSVVRPSACWQHLANACLYAAGHMLGGGVA